MKTLSFSHTAIVKIGIGILLLGMGIGLIPQADVLAQSADLGADLLFQEDRPEDAIAGGFREAIIGFVNYFLSFLGLLAVIFVIYAGILMLTSAGNEENTEKGKKILIWAGIGIIVVLLSFAIVRLFVEVGDTVV